MATVKWDTDLARVRVDGDIAPPGRVEVMTFDRARRLLAADGVTPDTVIDLALYVDGWTDPWTLYLDGNGNMRAICPTAPKMRPIVEREP